MLGLFLTNLQALNKKPPVAAGPTQHLRWRTLQQCLVKKP